MAKRSKGQKSNRSNNKFKTQSKRDDGSAQNGADHPPTALSEPGAQVLATSRQPKQEGRLVWNHSTHLQGLVPKLKKLCKQPGIVTVTPAVLGRARSNAPRLRLKVSVPIRGGYKLIARNGKSYQEVFVITSLDKGGLESAIAQSLS